MLFNCFRDQNDTIQTSLNREDEIDTVEIEIDDGTSSAIYLDAETARDLGDSLINMSNVLIDRENDANNTVVSMAEKLRDGTLQSPEQALRAAINDLGKFGAFKNCKKLLILALDESDDQFYISFNQAGMRMSECLALCEVAKTKFLKEMKHIS